MEKLIMWLLFLAYVIISLGTPIFILIEILRKYDSVNYAPLIVVISCIICLFLFSYIIITYNLIISCKENTKNTAGFAGNVPLD